MKQAILTGGAFLAGGLIGAEVGQMGEYDIWTIWSAEYGAGTILANFEGVHKDIGIVGRNFMGGFVSGLGAGSTKLLNKAQAQLRQATSSGMPNSSSIEVKNSDSKIYDADGHVVNAETLYDVGQELISKANASLFLLQ